MVKAIYSAKLLVASCILMLPVFSFAQIGSAARNDLGQKMEEGESNFTSFTSQSIRNIQHWDNNNSEDFKAHPEYGILPLNAPCSECVEVLEKRTANERYFVEINDYNKFYIQKSIGDLHRIIGNRWITIDHKLKSQGNNIYESPNQIEPIGLDLNQNYTYIKTSMGYLRFNNWSLYGEKDGVQTLISKANWSNRTVGEDGVKIKDIFPGMDAEMVVYRGSVKTNFIIKKNYNKQYDNIIFKDDFSHPTGGNFQFEEYPDVNRAVGTLLFKNNFGELAKVNPAIIYPKNGNKKDAEEAPYLINTNSMGVVVAVDWIEKYIGNYEIVVDPLVTGTNTLAQASIAGSGYNATCFVGFCPYFLSVNAPANAQFTNVLWSFTYIAQGLCWLNEGAVDFRLGACRSPGQANFFWFCNQTGGGTCTGTNIPIFNDISPCLPNPACVQQAVNFEMRFYRCFSAGAGCSNACIGANSPWIMTIQGMTIEYQSPVNPITVSATTICNGQIINASTSAQYGVTPYTYNWSFNPAGTPSVGTGANTTISFPGPGSYTLYSLVTDACGNTVTNSVGITVNPTPVATATPSSQTICSGQNTAIALSSTVGGTTYSWTVVQSGVSGAASGSGSNINQTLSTTGAAQGTATYTITPVANGCTGTPITVTVTVNPTPTATATPTSQTICSGQTTGINLTSNVAGTTFNWTVTQTGVSGAAAGSGATIAQTLTATGGAAGTATYTITPTANGCTGTPIIVTVTVNPTPDAIATPASQTICSGQNTGINLTSSVAGTTFNWTVTQTGVSGATAGTGSTITQTLTTTAAAQGTATYTITPSLGGCAGTPITVTITVNPTPDAIATPASQIICSGQTTGINLTSNIAGTTFNWTVTQTGVSGAAAGSGATIAQTLTATGGAAGTATYTITPTANGCTGTPIIVTVTVNPTPDAIATPASQTICSGQNTGINLTSSVAGTTFNWTVTQTGVSGATAGTGSTITQALTTTAAAQGTATYTITPSLGGCAGTPISVTVSVNPSEDATFAYNPTTFCLTSTNPTPTVTTPGGTFSGVGVVFVSTSTGEIDLASTGVGTYTVTYTTGGPCPATSSVTITITSAPDASFSFAASYCQNVSNPLPTFPPGASAGTFSSSPAGLVIDASTGEINLSASTPGTYTITNTIAAAGGCAPATANTTVVVNPVDDATFAYGGITFCQTGTNPQANITGLAGGLFSETSGTPGLVLNPSTGEIDLAGSSLGTYDVTYTTNGSCPSSSTVTITITSSPSANFTYSSTSYCNNSSNQLPGFGVGASAGVFSSSPAGLSINTTTGEINVGTSTPGIYTVTNFIAASGGCASATSTFTVEILSLDDATFSYSASTYCTSDVNQSPVISGLVGGTFTVTSGIGLDINASTGVVNPSGSSLGTYTITYTTNGPCPTSATFNLTIVDQQDATITPIGPFCNYDNPIGLIAANTGGTWSGPGVDPNTGIFNPTTAGSGTHTIVYTILGSCGDTDQITITVGGPNASFTANPSVGPAPLNVQYSNASSGSGLTYDWDFGDGNVSTSQNPSNTFGALGSYTTTLIVTDALGCSDTASIIISVVGETIVLIPNIFSPNGDGINDIFKITTVNVTSMEGFVFNRWGQELFSWTDLNGGWNGKTPKGDNASDGTYFYIIKIKTALDEEKEYTGSFSLIR
ncbi:MAG: PKD-like domain-containing protein [Flavobacteriales bacterium]